VKERIWTIGRLVECQSDCAQDPDCVGIEWGFVSTLPPGAGTSAQPTGPGRSYPQCTFFEIPSQITHVLPTGGECFIKPVPTVAVGTSPSAKPNPCVISKKCPCCHLAGPGVDFSAGPHPCEDLTFGDLRLMNLEGANLFNVDVTCASFEGANLKGAIFNEATGTNAIFARANLESAEFNNGALLGATFERANLVGAKFHHTNLENAIFDRAAVHGATFDHANMFQTSWWGAKGMQTAHFMMAQNVFTAKGFTAGAG